MAAKRCQLKTAKVTSNRLVSCPEQGWGFAIADAEERIAQLRRSIEMFKHNEKAGVPWPGESTRSSNAAQASN